MMTYLIFKLAILLISFRETCTVRETGHPCLAAIRNGYTEWDEYQDDLVYFRCHENHAIIHGPESAHCINNVLSINTLPSCKELTPPLTRVHLIYEDVECTGKNIKILKEYLSDFFGELECWIANTCTAKVVRHECIHQTKIRLEVLLHTPLHGTRNQIVEYLKKPRYNPSRVKRSPRPDLAASDNDTTCEDGSGVVNVPEKNEPVPGEEPKDGVICIKCAAGYYGSNSECKPCAKGTYSDEEGAVECKKCPDSMTTLHESSQNVSDCAVMCRLESTENGIYEVDTIKKLPGDEIKNGTEFKLVCNTGYYVSGVQVKTMTCGTADNLLRNCYKVSSEPSGDSIFFTDSLGSTVTCKVNTSITPSLFVLAKKPDEKNTDVNSWNMSISKTPPTESLDDVYTAVFTRFTEGNYTCVAVIEGHNQYIPNVHFEAVKLVVTGTPASPVIGYAGNSVTLTATATYHDRLSQTMMTWKKDGDSYATDITSGSDNTKFESKAVFSSLTLENRGTYSVDVSFKDQSHKEKATGRTSFTLDVVGLLTNPEDSFSDQSKQIIEGTAQIIKCKAGYSSSKILIKMLHKPTNGSYTDLILTSGPTSTGMSSSEWEITYTIAPATEANAGHYRCVISDGSTDRITGDGVEVKVVEGLVATPRINATNGATSYEVGGEDVILTCTSASDPGGSIGTYEWKVNGTEIKGESSNLYTLPKEDDKGAGAYTCVVTVSGNTSAESIEYKIFSVVKKESCSLASYSDSDLESRHIKSVSRTVLLIDETVKITCIDGYCHKISKETTIILNCTSETAELDVGECVAEDHFECCSDNPTCGGTFISFSLVLLMTTVARYLF